MRAPKVPRPSRRPLEPSRAVTLMSGDQEEPERSRRRAPEAPEPLPRGEREKGSDSGGEGNPLPLPRLNRRVALDTRVSQKPISAP